MSGYFRILSAIPGFFLSAFILMLLWNANINKLFSTASVGKIDYPAAMFVTIILWLAVAPLAAVSRKWR